MTLTAIILLVILGVVLLLLEVLVLPGGIVGIIGFAIIVLSIYLAYGKDNTTGHIVLASSVAVSVGLVYLSLRARTWDRLALNSNVESKSPAIDQDSIQVGDSGKAISRIAPRGTAKINGQLVEVTSLGDLIDEATELEVIKVEGTKIVVNPLT